MIAYKFLSAGAVGLFSRYAWPTPTADALGEWVRVDGEIKHCLNGVHACATAQLVEWLDDELWEIELESPVREADGELIAPAGRLIRRLERWDDECARAFVGQCVDNTVSLAAESLFRAGRQAEAEALTAARSGPNLELRVLQLARDLADEPASPVLFLADVARLERGGRPELADKAPTAEQGGPTPAALAANLGFVCAHIAAQLAEQESAGAYDESYAAERRRQSTWLAEKLQLEAD
ncbi:MAG: hypothetical protein H0V11_01660 [Actinobacteria bacterium]|nr:hypothetical protein [Actinomycetota bacterium]